MKNISALIYFPVIAIILAAIFEAGTTSCGPVSNCSEIQWGYSYGEFDHYKVTPDHITIGGTHYDPTGQPISPELIDRLTNEVNSCLTVSTFKVGCNYSNIKLPIDKTSFVVKIPDDAILSCDKTEQVLPTPVASGGAGCIAKGLTPTEICPCRWRAGIQCPNVLITAPNFFLYKDVLIRFVTGCGDPWSIPELATCATPSTTPLSDGSNPNNGL